MDVKVPCIPVDAHRCTFAILQRDLLRVASDPGLLCSKRVADVKRRTPDEVVAAELHDRINRRLEANKKQNTTRYCLYLLEVRAGLRDGFAPPISLFSETSFACTTPDGRPWSPGELAILSIPFGVSLVAFDGDTQLAARHLMCQKEPKAIHDYVSVTLIHGKDYQWARQAFHDVNTFGVKVQKKLALEMDHSDPITNQAKRIVQVHGLEVRRDHPTLSTIQSATKAFFGGIERASSKEPFDKAAIQQAEPLLDRWFDAIFQIFEERDGRDRFGVAASQGVMVALGAIGHRVQLKKDGDFAQTIASLMDVNWETGAHWLGIACKHSARKRDRDAIILDSGTHANWRATYEALGDRSSPLFTRIRHHHARAAS